MNQSLALYIHWPFCLSKCPYCDFNSHVRERIEISQFYEAFPRELARYHSLTPGRKIKSIFFGGGTPSLMPPSLTEAIINKASFLWGFEDGIEITLEANPNSSEVSRFQDFKQAGVNRISIGIQSLRNQALQFLGRKHSAKEGLQAIANAQQIFGRVSFDLIYARPHQTLEAWEEELTEALSFNTDHLSLYQLTIEEGTPFFNQHKRGDWAIPEDDLGGRFYELTQSLCEKNGMPAYEVSNHARSGFESQHNLIYWRYGDYLGLGPGAHGRFWIAHDSPTAQKVATRQIKVPEQWLEGVLHHHTGDAEVETITPDQMARERIMMGLRLKEGLQNFPASEEEEKAINNQNLAVLISEAYMEKTETGIKATPSGIQRLNSVLDYLLHYSN
jgi:putative oxygen-independent coproporphyrinogen III oxidase